MKLEGTTFETVYSLWQPGIHSLWKLWRFIDRLTGACHKKCIATKYKEGELTKGESVCLDRCVAKYLDIHERIGKKLTAMSLQDEKLMQKFQQQQQQWR